MTPMASVLIISYNHFATTTGPCLAALVQDPDFHSLEILVVDNASDEETVASLREIGKNYPAIRLIFNQDNRGFAGANNQMLQVALGEVIILLNSDTIPPPGSLSRLAALLREQPALGMISPVTNAAGNAQHIWTAGDNPIALLAEGAQWCRHGTGSVVPTDRLEFSCVAMTRGVYLAIGLLDEGFGRGYYEDVDYCQRAKGLNIAMHVVEEVFVYHKGSGSFKSIPHGVRQLMRENKARLLGKHPTVILKHRRQCNLAVLWHYVTLARRGGDAAAILWRFVHRLRLAQEELPRNPLKRLWYKLKIAHVSWAFHRAIGP